MPAICANATNPRLLRLRPRDYGRADASPEICCREGEHVRDIFGGSRKRWSLSLAPSRDLPAWLFFSCFLALWPDRGAAIAQNGRRHASSNSVIRHVIHNNCTGPAAWGPTLRASRNARTLLSARTRAQAAAKVASREWSSTTTPFPVDVGAGERRAQALVEDLQIRALVKSRRDAERDGRGNAPQTPVMNAKSH
jgi:hypothetical protein